VSPGREELHRTGDRWVHDGGHGGLGEGGRVNQGLYPHS